MKKITVLLFLYSLFLMGCIDQKMGKCEKKEIPVVVDFEYTLNAEHENKVVLDVTRMDLYAYDNQGVLRGYWRGEGDQFVDHMSISLTPGRYKFVAWGGEQQSASYRVEPLKVGETTYDQMRLSLIRDENHVVSTRSEHLYYGVSSEIEIQPGLNTLDISLIQNTNNIKVVAHQLINLLPNAELPEGGALDDIFGITIRGANACYKFDNQPDWEQSSLSNVIYRPHTQQLIEGGMESDFRVQRLIRRETSRSVSPYSTQLQLHNLQTGEVIQEWDLVEQILATHPLVSADPEVGLDQYSDYQIDLVYSPTEQLQLYVTVNGWKVRVISGELE